MNVEPGSGLPLIDKTLEECSKSVCRLVHVLRQGKDWEPVVWLAYGRLRKRYSGLLECNNPQAVVFITAETAAREPYRLLAPAPMRFRESFQIRIGDDEREMLDWVRIQEHINKFVRRRLWTVAALMYDDFTGPTSVSGPRRGPHIPRFGRQYEETRDQKLERIKHVLNLNKARTDALMRQVESSTRSSRRARSDF